MNNIFSNLAIRNADRPSPEVLQPRLPSLFEPSDSADGPPEALLDQPLSFSPRVANRDEAVRPSPSRIDRESSSPSNASIQEPPPAINIKDSYDVEEFSKHLDMESARKMIPPQSTRIQQSPTPSETIHAFFVKTSFEEIQNDQHRSGTIMSDGERIPARASAKDLPPGAVIEGERIVHPRAERVMANKVDRLVEPSRVVPGRADKSMDVLKPREESNRAEPSVVRIHIGRIDVRAITPPPPQPASKPAPAQPRMTLDDYLRQREGRR